MSGKILDEKEVKRLLQVVEFTSHKERNRLIVQLGLLGGLRSMEITNLKVGDVVTNDNRVKEVWFLKKEQVKGSKNNKVYISDRLQKELLRYFAKYPHLLTKKEGYLITTQKRTKFSPQSLQNEMKNWFKGSGLDNCSSHSLRRTFITNLSNKMINIRVIQKLSRHSNLNTTQLYIETNDIQLLKGVNL